MITKTAPHIVQYQGSKRNLAPLILQYMPHKFNRLIEPFAGMAVYGFSTKMTESDCVARLLEMYQELVK